MIRSYFSPFLDKDWQIRLFRLIVSFHLSLLNETGLTEIYDPRRAHFPHVENVSAHARQIFDPLYEILITSNTRISCRECRSKSRVLISLQRIYATDLIRPDTSSTADPPPPTAVWGTPTMNARKVATGIISPLDQSMDGASPSEGKG